MPYSNDFPDLTTAPQKDGTLSRGFPTISGLAEPCEPCSICPCGHDELAGSFIKGTDDLAAATLGNTNTTFTSGEHARIHLSTPLADGQTPAIIFHGPEV